MGEEISSSNSNSNTNGGAQACAVCRFQRRRCNASCPLAKYFPAKENERFMNCKRLYGVSNMLRLLNQVGVNDRDETMRSLMFEADVREQDPVLGCMGIISKLQQQVEALTLELASIREQLNYYVVQHQQRHDDQQQEFLEPRSQNNLRMSVSLDVCPQDDHSLVVSSTDSACCDAAAATSFHYSFF